MIKKQVLEHFCRNACLSKGTGHALTYQKSLGGVLQDHRVAAIRAGATVLIAVM